MKNWLHYIIKDDGRSAYVSNGLVSYTGTRRPLQYAPVGEMVVAWERNMAKHGLVRSYSNEVTLRRDAATIVRDAMFRKGVEEKLFLMIQQLRLELDMDAQTYRWLYKYFYKGELDLSTFESGDTSVTATIMEGGLSKLLKANENTEYQVLLDDDAVNVKMDGILLNESHKFIVQEETFPEIGYQEHVPGIIFVLQEGEASGITTYTVYASDDPITDFVNDSRYFMAVTQDVADMNLKGSVKIQSADGVYKLLVKTSSGATITLIDQHVSEGETEIPFDQTFNAVNGDKFFLIASMDPDGALSNVNYLETNIELKFQSRYPETIIKAFPLHVLFKKLVAKITGSEDDAESAILLANPDLAITSGDAIRGIEGAYVKTKLSDFLANADAILMTGSGVKNGKIIIEGRETFYDSSEPIELGEVKNFVVSYARDLVCNRVKAGSANPSIEAVNGRYEFNGNSTYTLPYTRDDKEYSIVSPYKSAAREVELTRLNLDNKTTTDANTDNETFNIVLNTEAPETTVDGVVYPLLRENYSLLELDGDPALLTNTVFNIEYLTPKRMLLRHGRWIRSMMYGMDGGKVIFQSSTRNSTLKTTNQAGVTVDEDKNETISTLGPLMWKPWYFDFDTEVPLMVGDQTLVEILEENPFRCFTGTIDGLAFKGFAIKTAISVSDQQAQQFKLLMAPEVDELLFIE